MKQNYDDILEGVIIDESYTVSFEELSSHCQISKTQIEEMVDLEILETRSGVLEDWFFNAKELLSVQKAMRLHIDLSINFEGIAIILDLMERLGKSERHIQQLQRGIKDE